MGPGRSPSHRAQPPVCGQGRASGWAGAHATRSLVGPTGSSLYPLPWGTLVPGTPPPHPSGLCGGHSHALSTLNSSWKDTGICSLPAFPLTHYVDSQVGGAGTLVVGFSFLPQEDTGTERGPFQSASSSGAGVCAESSGQSWWPLPQPHPSVFPPPR